MLLAMKRESARPVSTEGSALIREAIARQRTTQAVVASVAGIDPSTLSRILSEKRGFLLDEWVAVCNALRLDPVGLLERCIAVSARGEGVVGPDGGEVGSVASA